MKDSRHLPSLRVDSCQVRAFVQIAAVASQRQIIGIIGAAVLLCRDVFNMMPQAAMFLVQTTIFATTAVRLQVEQNQLVGKIVWFVRGVGRLKCP